MKIQNTEMEFVAFDTQDVIATSGPVGVMDYYGLNTASGYKLSNDLFSGINVEFTSAYAALGDGFTSGSGHLAPTYGPDTNTAYAVTGIKGSSSSFEFVYTKESDFLANNPGAAGNNLYSSDPKTSVTDVLDWLVKNMSLLQ